MPCFVSRFTQFKHEIDLFLLFIVCPLRALQEDVDDDVDLDDNDAKIEEIVTSQSLVHHDDIENFDDVSAFFVCGKAAMQSKSIFHTRTKRWNEC